MYYTIIVCANHERIDLPEEQAEDWIQHMGEFLEKEKGADIFFDMLWETWNGGTGKGEPLMYLRYDGYGKVSSFGEARAAVIYMMGGMIEPEDGLCGAPADTWPGSEETENALDLLDEAVVEGARFRDILLRAVKTSPENPGEDK